MRITQRNKLISSSHTTLLRIVEPPLLAADRPEQAQRMARYREWFARRQRPAR